jgi:hypothetical protein
MTTRTLLAVLPHTFTTCSADLMLCSPLLDRVAQAGAKVAGKLFEASEKAQDAVTKIKEVAASVDNAGPLDYFRDGLAGPEDAFTLIQAGLCLAVVDDALHRCIVAYVATVLPCPADGRRHNTHFGQSI